MSYASVVACLCGKLLHEAMGGASNIVGEFAEQLVADYYRGTQLTASSKSADIKDPGRAACAS